MRALALALALVAGTAAAASADTLYVAAPPPSAPGHPMRLGADHRAQQVGDLVTVSFAQAYSNSTQDATSTSKSASIGASSIFPKIPTSVGGQTGSASSNVRTGAVSFVSQMVAVVTNVLPSGALQIAGDSRMNINGQPAVLHVTGIVRVEDIDNTDAVPSNRIGALDARFDGNFSDPGKGLIRRVLDVLF